MGKQSSTYERLMQDLEFKKEFDIGYRKFLLSELAYVIKDNNEKAIKELKTELGI